MSSSFENWAKRDRFGKKKYEDEEKKINID